VRGYLTHEQKQMGFRLKAQGWSLVDIGREIGCSAPMVGLMVRDGRFRQGIPDAWSPRPGCLTILDREQILLGLGRGESMSAVARKLRRSPSTITREVGSNGGRGSYSAWHAHQRARSLCTASQAGQASPGPAPPRGLTLAEGTVVASGDRSAVSVGFSGQP